MSVHDHLCESKRLIAPAPYGMCRCTWRAWENDPLPAEDMPIYLPWVDLRVDPVPTSGGTWADRQITPEEMQTSEPHTDSVCVPTEEGTS